MYHFFSFQQNNWRKNTIFVADMKKNYCFLSSAWLVAMLLWASVANAQNQDDFFSKVVELLNEMLNPMEAPEEK